MNWSSFSSRYPAKGTSWHVRPLKTQISLRIRAVRSESSMWAQWRAKGPTSFQVENWDSDQTVWMRRLIWIAAVRTCQFVPNEGDRLIPLLRSKLPNNGNKPSEGIWTGSTPLWGVCLRSSCFRLYLYPQCTATHFVVVKITDSEEDKKKQNVS